MRAADYQIDLGSDGIIYFGNGGVYYDDKTPTERALSGVIVLGAVVALYLVLAR